MTPDTNHNPLGFTARVIPQPTMFLLRKLDNARLRLPLLFNLLMFMGGANHHVNSEEETQQQLLAIEYDPQALEYYHLLFHAFCQYVIVNGGQVKGVYEEFNDDFDLTPLRVMSSIVQVEGEPLKLLYQGKRITMNFLKVLGWYSRQLPEFPFVPIMSQGRFIDHVYQLALSDRTLLAANRDWLYGKLTA